MLLLEQAARQADAVAALEAEVERSGIATTGSRGQARLSQSVVELRQARIALSRLLGALALPDDENRPETAASRRARNAAEARWSAS